jgi:hypothetical protein
VTEAIRRHASNPRLHRTATPPVRRNNDGRAWNWDGRLEDRRPVTAAGSRADTPALWIRGALLLHYRNEQERVGRQFGSAVFAKRVCPRSQSAGGKVRGPRRLYSRCSCGSASWMGGGAEPQLLRRGTAACRRGGRPGRCPKSVTPLSSERGIVRAEGEAGRPAMAVLEAVDRQFGQWLLANAVGHGQSAGGKGAGPRWPYRRCSCGSAGWVGGGRRAAASPAGHSGSQARGEQVGGACGADLRGRKGPGPRPLHRRCRSSGRRGG